MLTERGTERTWARLPETTQEHLAAPRDQSPVVVQREWNDWRTAAVRMGDLQDIHWFRPDGTPRPLIHAYVRCSLLAGSVPHDCQPESRPHIVRVCVLKSHTLPTTFAELSRRADRRRSGDATRPNGT